MLTNKQIPFITKLIIFNKERQQFPITVAGIYYNYLFSNFTFFQRTEKNSHHFIWADITKPFLCKKM